VTELPRDLRRAIESWLLERKLETTSIRAGDRNFDLGRVGA